MCALFRKAGITSEFLVGNTKYQTTQARERIFNTFSRTNEIEILCVVNITNEGINIPDITCAIMARPTRSNIVYQQQIGRPCRWIDYYKKYFVLLDYVDNTRKGFHSYNLNNLKQKSTPSKGIVVEYLDVDDPIKVNKRIKQVTKGVEEFEKIARETPEELLEKINDWLEKKGHDRIEL